MPDVLQGPHPPRGSHEVWPFAIARPVAIHPAAAKVRNRLYRNPRAHSGKIRQAGA